MLGSDSRNVQIFAFYFDFGVFIINIDRIGFFS